MRSYYVSMLWLAALVLIFSAAVQAQDTTVSAYSIGSPTLTEIWVDVNNGSDSNSGTSSEQALQSITAAWNQIPSGNLSGTGYVIKIRRGSYAESLIPNYWENKRGTANFPIILESADGVGEAVLLGDINAYNVHYFYVLGLEIIPGGDAFHCELCEYVLLRDVTLNGEDQAHETIKVNQSEHFYIESSFISGAGDNAIDFVAVQYGHIINSRVSLANDWCVYVKGGSAYITFANNIVHNCGTGGFTAGQGTGLEFMTYPWTRYEAYSIKAFNNVFYDIEGASLGVNGGLDILIAYNTSYRIGDRSHVFEAVFGLRSCDGNNAGCASRVGDGGWGPSNSSQAEQSIPNKNVYIYNNIFYNPSGFTSLWQHLAIYDPRTPAMGTNIPNPARTDVNLRISSNIIWNGDNSMPLGIEGSQACIDSNPTCNVAQLLADNEINQVEPEFRDPAAFDFRPEASGNLFSHNAEAIPDFTGADHAQAPATPVGNNSNTISRDMSGEMRSGAHPRGAYSSSEGALNPEIPEDSTDSIGPVVENIVFRPGRNVRQGVALKVRANVTDASSISRVNCRVGSARVRIRLRNGLYRGRLFPGQGVHNARIIARDSVGNRTRQSAGQVTIR